ncbi:MAG: GDP-mannose 4,6-dehydratase [Desulfococcaceae bacterium]
MNALIFGANGQDGYYVSELCRSSGMTVKGISRTGAWIQGDVADYEQVEHFVKKYQPAFIFNLAANSTTRHDAVFDNHRAISTGTLNILEAVKRNSPESRVFVTGSGVQFKNRGIPISERDEFDPNSPYSVARIHSVYAARYYRSLGIKAYVGYLFHHESPLRKPNHLSQIIVNAVRGIANGNNGSLELGDISVEKEWTFAGDVAEGILTLMWQDEVMEAVIGSGIKHSVLDWVKECFQIIGKDWREYVRLKEGFVPEYNCLVSDPSTIFSLGWKPKVNLKSLAELMMKKGNV